MNIKKNCYLCIYTQIYNVTVRLNLDEKISGEILRATAKDLSKYDLTSKPPLVAADLYSNVSKILNKKDLFEEAKKTSISEAKNIKPVLKEKLLKSKNRLFDACKIAVAGNVIDLGVNQKYDIKKELKRIFEMNFYKNDFFEFEKKIKSAKTVCYLADNAGENIFDEILIETIKEINSSVRIYYIVRGKPIINDVTKKDLKGLDIWNLADVIDSGVDTPGFCLEKANKNSLEIFYNSDMVISKGMGNFESLFGECKKEIFYMFKVKCEPVAEISGSKKGEYMLFKGLN